MIMCKTARKCTLENETWFWSLYKGTSERSSRPIFGIFHYSSISAIFSPFCNYKKGENIPEVGPTIGNSYSQSRIYLRSRITSTQRIVSYAGTRCLSDRSLGQHGGSGRPSTSGWKAKVTWIHRMTMTSFAITPYGQYCRLHVVGQQIVATWHQTQLACYHTYVYINRETNGRTEKCYIAKTAQRSA